MAMRARKDWVFCRSSGSPDGISLAERFTGACALDNEERARVGNGKGPQEQRVGEAIYRGVGADSEGQRKHRNRRESGIVAKSRSEYLMS